MTITIRPSSARGHANHGWLDSYHSFSFANYFDPAHMGYRSLRVINDDVIAGGGGFPTHGHRDMEIVSYIVAGGLAHRDSTGAQGVLHRGDVQHMSAGTGVRHSEFNASATEAARLLQIWILPEKEGLTPYYDQTQFPDAAKTNQLRLLAAPGGPDGSLPIRQDARILASILEPGASVSHVLEPGRGAWVQVVDGAIEIAGQTLAKGDAAAIEDLRDLTFTSKTGGEFLLFDLA
jgi:redox-sensitive bicupin YhaK (pirin superfamily)